jgi:hypothetical protein
VAEGVPLGRALEVEPVETVVHFVATEGEDLVPVRLAPEQRRVREVEGEVERQDLPRADEGGRGQHAVGVEEVDGADAVIGPEHVPAVAQVEAGHLGQVVEGREVGHRGIVGRTRRSTHTVR